MLDHAADRFVVLMDDCLPYLSQTECLNGRFVFFASAVRAPEQCKLSTEPCHPPLQKSRGDSCRESPQPLPVYAMISILRSSH